MGSSGAGLVVLVVALCLILCVLLAQPRGAPTRLPSELLIVRAEDVRQARASHGDSPWLVIGLPETPDVGDWGEAWKVTDVNVLLSPSGVFGAYGGCERHTELSSSGVVGFSEQECRRDPRCLPAHASVRMPPPAAVRLFEDSAARPAGARFVYLRGTAGEESRRAEEAKLGWLDLSNLSPYLSSSGCTTNLHWDGAPGILAQTAGSKDVTLFAPGAMPDAARDTVSPCYRRSYQQGAECPPGWSYRLLLAPGFGLYIPALWAHHVVSKAPRTLGAVWRFAGQ